MAYSVKWAVLRTKKMRVLRSKVDVEVLVLRSGTSPDIRLTKKLLCAFEESGPKDDIAKIKSIWKIRNAKRIVAVFEWLFGVFFEVMFVIGSLRLFLDYFLWLVFDLIKFWYLVLEIFLELGLGAVDRILVWVPDKVLWLRIGESGSDVSLAVNVD